MANHTLGAGQPDEQGSSPEGMRQREEQAPEQEEHQHQEQGESDQAQMALVAPQEPAHEPSDMQTQATPQQGELSQEQQEPQELVELPLEQPNNAIPNSSPAEPPEREMVSAALEQQGEADE